MTISSLLKKLLGVNGLVVDEVEFQGPESGKQMIVQGHVTKHERQRCPVCGVKCPLYDQGRGARRWRALDTEKQHEGVHPGGCATDCVPQARSSGVANSLGKTREPLYKEL